MDPYAIENPDTQRSKVRKERIHDGNCSAVARMCTVSRGVIKSAAWYAACGYIQMNRTMTEPANHENERSRCVFLGQVARELDPELQCQHDRGWNG